MSLSVAASAQRILPSFNGAPFRHVAAWVPGHAHVLCIQCSGFCSGFKSALKSFNISIGALGLGGVEVRIWR